MSLRASARPRGGASAAAALSARRAAPRHVPFFHTADACALLPIRKTGNLALFSVSLGDNGDGGQSTARQSVKLRMDSFAPKLNMSSSTSGPDIPFA